MMHLAQGGHKDMAEAKYKWDTPLEWLIQKAGSWNATQLFNEFCAMAQTLDLDTIQDLYQSDMDADGYFDRYVTCPQCEGHDSENCQYCEGEKVVSQGSADEWHRQNDDVPNVPTENA